MKKIMFMLTAAALITGCAGAEMDDRQEQEQQQANGRDITARSAHQLVSGELTRVPYIGHIANDNQLPARVLTFNGPLESSASDADSDKLLCDGHFQFTARATPTAYTFGASMATGTGKYHADAAMFDSYKMVGLYPQTTWTGTPTTVAAILTHTITGFDDIMVADMQTVSKDDVLANEAPTLTFRHQLAKFEVKIKAKDGAAQALWDSITSIQLTGLKQYADSLPSTFTYTLNNDGAKTYPKDHLNTPLNFFTIDNSGTKPMYKDNVYAGATGTILADTAKLFVADPVAYTMAPAFTPTNDADVTIVVKAVTTVAGGTAGTPDNVPFTIKVPLPLLDGGITSAGYAYRISLTFADKSTITAEAEVIDWEDGGESDFVLM